MSEFTRARNSKAVSCEFWLSSTRSPFRPAHDKKDKDSYAHRVDRNCEMPSSPRPPNSDSTTPILVRTADTTSDAELLSLIENARSAVARARDATEQYAPRRTTTTLEELADDPAASSLLERHTRRRDMELEWDERDTDRRARELIARLENDPPPNHLVDLDDDDSEDEVMVLGETGAQGDRWDYSGPTLGRRPLTAAQLERYGLSPYGGTLRESEEDDDEFYEPETAIFGFDGDVTDEDEEDELDMSNDEVSTAPRPSSIWPGLLGERPLNPSSPETLLDENRNLPKAKAPYGNDPSSSTSFTSFLSPGATFKGQQVTSGRPTSRRTAPRPAQIVQARARRSVGSAERARSGVSEGDPASTAHPSFAPVSSSTPSLPGTVRDQQASSVFNSTADPTQAFLLGPLRPTSSTSSSTSHPNVSSTELAASNRTSSSRYAPYSSHTPVDYPSTTSAATIPSAPIPPNLSPVERARLSIARSHNPGARSNPASWREVADELLVSLRTDDESAAAERAAAIASGREEERWEVQVILSVSPYALCKTKYLTCLYLLHAHAIGRRALLRPWRSIAHWTDERLWDPELAP